MSRLLPAPPPLAPCILACGSQLTRRWVRDGFNGHAPGMAGHLIATYHGPPQDCVWKLEGRRFAEQLRPGTVTVVGERHDGHWTLSGPIAVSHVYLTNERLLSCAEEIAGGRRVEIMDRLGFEDPVSAHILGILSDEDVLTEPGARLLVEREMDLLCLQLLRRHNAGVMPGAAWRAGRSGARRTTCSSTWNGRSGSTSWRRR